MVHLTSWLKLLYLCLLRSPRAYCIRDNTQLHDWVELAEKVPATDYIRKLRNGKWGGNSSTVLVDIVPL
jgi:hypothetical protein